MKLAVIMPARNAAHTIASALASLLCQGVAAQLQIIVVDDGSTDRTADIVAGIAAGGAPVVLIRTAQQGIAGARNAALGGVASDTDFLAFLDADDLSPAGRFARDLALFADRPDLDLVYARTRYFDVEDSARLAPSARGRTLDARIVQLGSAVYRHALIEAVGLFDESLVQAEDLDFLLRLFEREPVCHVSDDIGLYYRINHGGITENRAQARREFMRALRKAGQRRKRLGGFQMPEGLFTSDHTAELESWRT